MSNNKIIQNVNKLIQFELNKGVSPFELMKNITEDDYYEISIKKQKNGYICDVKFSEYDEFDNINKLIFRYSYDNEMTLLQISIVKNKNIQTSWTRESEQRRLLSEILCLFDNDMSKKLFIDQLPSNLKILVDEEHEISM